MKVGYRDPRRHRAGGRTPWKVPLEPCIVEDVRGNKCVLRRTADGSRVEDAHAEDVVLIPEDAEELEERRGARMRSNCSANFSSEAAAAVSEAAPGVSAAGVSPM